MTTVGTERNESAHTSTSKQNEKQRKAKVHFREGDKEHHDNSGRREREEWGGSHDELARKCA